MKGFVSLFLFLAIHSIGKSQTPVASFSATPIAFCNGWASIPVTFTDHSSNSPTSWNWSFPGGTPSSSILPNPVITYSAHGFFDVKLVVTNSFGTDSITLVNYVQADGVPMPSSVIGPNIICNNSTNTYSTVAVQGISYSWSIPSGWTSTSFNDSLVTTANTTGGNVGLSLSNHCGGSSSGGITVFVYSSIVPSVTVTCPSNDICAGAITNFSAVIVNGGVSPAYQWKLNGSNVGTNFYNYSNSALVNSDVVSCVLTSSNSCSTPPAIASNSIDMVVHPILNPAVSISANPSGVIGSGTNVTFTATPVNGGSSPVYQWKQNGSNVGTNSDVYSEYGLINGDVISCKMTSNENCVTTNFVNSNTISMMVSPLGISEVTEDGRTSVYPNPFSERLSISSKEKISGIELIDPRGREILNSSGGFNLNTSEIMSGIYFLKITTDSGISVFKVIK